MGIFPLPRHRSGKYVFALHDSVYFTRSIVYNSMSSLCIDVGNVLKPMWIAHLPLACCKAIME